MKIKVYYNKTLGLNDTEIQTSIAYAVAKVISADRFDESNDTIEIQGARAPKFFDTYDNIMNSEDSMDLEKVIRNNETRAYAFIERNS